MIKRTLYFGNPAYLSLKDRQMVIDLPETEVNPEMRKTILPLEDIGVVVLDSPRLTITLPLLNALIENNTSVITCNSKHMPSSMFLPLEGNTVQAERFRSQMDASVPLKKQLWQQTVQAKIDNQARLLSMEGIDAEPMHYWRKNVRSGDPDNFEARAAAFYWKNLFDLPEERDFIRGRFEGGPNNFLNYGYAVLRAVIARSLVGTGLLPTLGIHHHNRYNAFCLADDIMEPYRPFVDMLVLNLVKNNKGDYELTKEVKAKLLEIPVLDVIMNGNKSPLMVASQRTSASLNDCFEGTSRRILFPEFS